MKTLKLLVVFFLLPFFSCQTEGGEEPTLTPNQWEALRWTDFAAGLASAELGPISFAIGAAASTAYYYDHLPEQNLASLYVPIPFTSTYTDDRIGVDHNKFCQLYIEKGYTEIDYLKVKNIAIEVRPDLLEEISSLQTEYIANIVNLTKSYDFSNEDVIANFTKEYINFNETDFNTYKTKVISINSETNATFRSEKITNLIQGVDSFALSSSEKQHLKQSLEIFKFSTLLWKH